METRAQKVYAADGNVSIDIIPGHFVTNHSHVNYYVDLTSLKTHHRMAKSGASILASKYAITPVDTILCMEGTEVVGAFLAAELSQNRAGVNFEKDINVLTPESNANNQLIFRDNTSRMVWGKNILLLLASVSTGKTIKRTLECLEYYNGNLVGIGALFSAAISVAGIDVQSIFPAKDLADYKSYDQGNCEMCKGKMKVDALINSFGYSKL